jgi:hypothetical protein
LVISLLLLFHLAAVISAPYSMSRPLLAQDLRTVFRPYLQACFLDHGYQFFAPEPGPSHLVRYELQLADGTKREGVFPNLKEHWPRLLYHRHFMLSEFINGLYAPPEAPAAAQTQFKAYTKSYAQHLLHAHNAEKVTLYLRRHLIATPQDVGQGMQLDNSRLYEELPLGAYTRADL